MSIQFSEIEQEQKFLPSDNKEVLIKNTESDKKKKKSKNNESAKFDFVFIKRFTYIVFKILGIFTPLQVLCFILIFVFAFGYAYLEYYGVIQYSLGITKIGSGGITDGWSIVAYLSFASLGQFFCELMIKNGWVTFFLYYDWRKRLTKYLLGKYFDEKNYYVILNLQDNKIDNPDQRIHSDTSDFCKNLSISFTGAAFYLFNMFFNLACLIDTKVYWILIPIFAIPIISFIVYTILFSTVSKTVFQKDTLEGDFRFAHARIREHAESMAFFKSEKLERGIIEKVFGNLIKKLKTFSYKLLFLNTYSQITYWVPSGVFLVFLVILSFARVYPLDGSLSYDEEGALMNQVFMFAQNLAQSLSNALKLSQNLSVVIGNTARIGGMIEALKSIEKKVKTEPVDSILSPLEKELIDEEISFEGVNISTPTGKKLFENLHFRIKKGQSMIIMGPSGKGKSSILRSLCGLWEYEGKIRKINIENLFFLPQKPYLIQGTLMDNIIYPKTIEEVDICDEEVEKVMKLANIHYLLSRASLHKKNVSWEEKLSLGEMQRIAMARLFFHSPSWAVLDECTSALDPENERLVYGNAIKCGITLISVAHRKSVAKFHDVILEVGTDTPEGYRFLPLKDIDSSIQSFEWHREKYYQPSNREIFSEKSNRMNLESNDKNLGNTGINLVLIKRLWRMIFKKIMVRGFWNWVLVLILIACSFAYALTPIVIVISGSSIIGYALDKDLQNSIIFGSLIFLGFVLIALGAGTVFFVSSMQGIIFRNNVTKYLHERYFKMRMFFKVNAIDKTIDNIDQRICSDVDLLTSGFEFNPGISFMEQQLFTSIFQCTAFLIVAFYSSVLVGFASIALLVIAGLFQILFMVLISKLRFLQQKREGFMRFSLTRMKEYSEQIAFYNGVKIEKTAILKRLEKVLSNQVILYALQSLSESLVSFINKISVPIAFVIIILSIYTGIIKISEMKTSDVLTMVQMQVGILGNVIFSFVGALNSLARIGDITGTVGRVGEFIEKMDELEEKSKTNVEDDLGLRVNEPSFVECVDLNGFTPNRKPLFKKLSFKLNEGKSLLIKGPSGCGKSSLLRMIGGLWTIDNGKIYAPQDIGMNGIFFLPQKAYLILGSLKEQIIYPDKESSTSDDGLLEILKKVNLDYIYDRLGENWESKKEWSVILSPGEQQRLSVARLLYHRPKFAILDECTSSLDEENEKLCYEVIKNEGISYISVGHRQTLGSFHEYLLQFNKEGGWSYKVKTGRKEEIKIL